MNKMRIMKQLLSLFLLLLGINSYAQDVHFSNIKMSSLYTSIASVGSSHAQFRATTHYRNQWPTVGKSYQTIGLTADYKLKLDDKALGFGFIMNRDQAGALSLTKLQAEGVVAYHQRVSDHSFFSGGIQGGIIQHSIDESAAEWQNQYNGKQFDPNLPSNEAPLFQPFMNYTFGAGMMWRYDKTDRNRFSKTMTELEFGMSLYHVVASALDYNTSQKEYTRLSLTGSSTIVLEYAKSELEPAFLYQIKGNEKEFVFGMLYKYILREGSKYTGYYDRLDMSFGSYYRLPNDAFIPTFNMNYDNFQFGVSYDVNVSPLIQASSSVGGIEFTLRFVM